MFCHYVSIWLDFEGDEIHKAYEVFFNSPSDLGSTYLLGSWYLKRDTYSSELLKYRQEFLIENVDLPPSVVIKKLIEKVNKLIKEV